MEIKKNFKKIIAVSLAVICFAAFVIMTVVTDGFGIWREKQSSNIEFSSNDKSILVAENDGIKLFMGTAVMVAATSESNAYVSRTVTAVISPSTVVDQYVSWTLSWKSGCALEGETLSDYICLTDESQGSLTATVNAYKAFRGSDVILTCMTRQEHRTAVCTVAFEGIPSSLSINPLMVLGGTYDLGTDTVDLLYAGKTYTYAISMDNIFHDVGIGYADFTVTVTGIGSFTSGTYTASTRGAGWQSDSLSEISLDSVKNDLISVSVTGSTLSIEAKQSYMAYYSSSEEENVEGNGLTTYYYDKYKQSITDIDGNVPYFLVTVTHRTLYFSSTYKVFIGESVDSVSLSNSVMNF